MTESATTQTTADEARQYIKQFRVHTLPGVSYVDTKDRRIQLDQMNDDDALFVATEFQNMEAQAAKQSRKVKQ